MLAPWKEIYDKSRQHVKKQRHHFANKGPYSQSYGFSSSHVRCESRTMRKAKYQRTDTFKFWCWRRLLRVSWTTRTSNQSILKDINSEYSLERLLLKLKLQYFDHLIRRANSLELLCWRRVLRVPWTARRSNQFILKEISPEYLSEGLMLKLKLQYFGHLMQRTDSFERDPNAGKDWGQKEKGMEEDEMVR